MEHQTAGQQTPHTYQWLSFGYQSLTEIPYDTILMQTDSLEVLDLSYNLLDEYPFVMTSHQAFQCVIKINE